MIRAALIKRDDIGPQPSLFLALFFDLRDRVAARFARIIRRHARLHRCVHARSYILDRYQHVQLEISAFDFVGVRLRVKTVLQIIVLLA